MLLELLSVDCFNILINELENEWKPRSGDNEEIKARYGYYIDVHALYDMYVHMCAEALALQFLTFSLSDSNCTFVSNSNHCLSVMLSQVSITLIID